MTQPEKVSKRVGRPALGAGGKQRLQFDFSDDGIERLDELVSLLRASSRAEVIRRALALLEEAVEARNQGGELLMRDVDGQIARVRLF